MKTPKSSLFLKNGALFLLDIKKRHIVQTIMKIWRNKFLPACWPNRITSLVKVQIFKKRKKKCKRNQSSCSERKSEMIIKKRFWYSSRSLCTLHLDPASYYNRCTLASCRRYMYIIPHPSPPAVSLPKPSNESNLSCFLSCCKDDDVYSHRKFIANHYQNK